MSEKCQCEKCGPEDADAGISKHQRYHAKLRDAENSDYLVNERERKRRYRR